MGDRSGNRSNAVVTVFSGEHDLTSSRQLRAALTPLCEVPRAVLDFSNVRYVDSSIISELARLHKARSARGLDGLTFVIDALGKNERIVVQYAPSPVAE